MPRSISKHVGLGASRPWNSDSTPIDREGPQGYDTGIPLTQTYPDTDRCTAISKEGHRCGGRQMSNSVSRCCYSHTSTSEKIAHCLQDVKRRNGTLIHPSDACQKNEIATVCNVHGRYLALPTDECETKRLLRRLLKNLK